MKADPLHAKPPKALPGSRRSFLGAAWLLLAAIPLRLNAQSEKKVFRIAFVDHSLEGRNFDAFRTRMGELAYVEPRNLEIRSFQIPSYHDLEKYVRPAIAWNPDLVVVGGPAVLRVRQLIPQSMPLVFLAADAVMAELVESLSRPGRNMTGVSWSWEKGKWLELATRLVPRKRRFVGLVDSSTLPEDERHLPIKFHSTEELGVEVTGIDVSRHPGGIREVLASLRPGSFDALLTIGTYSETTYAPLSAYVEFQRRTRIPCIMQSESSVEQGAVMFRGPDGQERGRLVAEQVARILKGARAGELPVMRSTRFRVVINRRAATEIGLKIPPDLLLLADRVID